MTGTFWLTEEQFSKIKVLLPNKPRGVPRVDDRRVLSGIIFCLQRGYRWSDVPAEYGPAKTLYNRYKRWSGAGVFERIFKALAQETADFQTLMIDATHVKTHRIAANGVKKTPVTGVQSGERREG
jgi:putative transposase